MPTATLGRRVARHNHPKTPQPPRGQRWAVVWDREAFDFGTFYGLDAYVRAHGDQWAVLRYDSEPTPAYIRDTPAAAMAAWDSHVKEQGGDRATSPDEEEPPREAP